MVRSAARAISPHLQLPRLSQIRIDPRLPTIAGLAIRGQHIRIEPELYGLLRILQRRPAATDDPVAVPDFGPIEEPVRQRRRIIGVNPCGGARLLLPWHDSTSSK